MPNRIEDYALLSDTESAALVGRDGSVDWLTFPRFDSAACFAALLGTPDHGRWLLAPAGEVRSVERRYRPGTLVLETRFTTADGVVDLIDCMPVREEGRLDLVRLVRGVSGRVPMRMHLTVRMDYGSTVPWARRVPEGLRMVAGPDALTLATAVDHRPDGWATVADFTVGEGDEVPFDLAWRPSHLDRPEPIDVAVAIEDTTGWWQDWTDRCSAFAPYDEPIRQSLTVLKGLTYAPTGGIVAAATTSLPEVIGGSRNWDYRYCWLRDATFTLTSFLDAGYTDEACAWRDWLLRAVAGRPEQVQIMYGPAGERRLTELELDWLPGYEGSSPVRVGNDAHDQFQLDVFGEVLDVLHAGRDSLFAADRGGPTGGDSGPEIRSLLGKLADVVVERWREPDDGIWEVRSGRQQFTYSKVMAWVAFDRAARAVERYGLGGPAKQWRATANEIHRQVCTEAFDAERNTFTQAYGSKALDASVLLIPQVGFLPPSDPRVVGTIDAVHRELAVDGFIRRYVTEHVDDGLPDPEGAFLICSFWLADSLAMIGRVGEARNMYEKLVALRNDVGLLSEEYDPVSKRMLGNFPQAFSHLGMVNTAWHLSGAEGCEPLRRSAY
jgi:GH15 family glucan-1,4-alpha-glucosidase